MSSIDFERRRLKNLRSRVLGGHTSLQIVVGAVIIAALALAFVFRPGQSSEEVKSSTAAPRSAPTAAVAAAIPTATVTPVPPQERTHVVVTGDNLTGLAQKYYGDASKWEKIYEANKDTLKSPDSLQLGQKLKIPN